MIWDKLVPLLAMQHALYIDIGQYRSTGDPRLRVALSEQQALSRRIETVSNIIIGIILTEE